MEQAKMDIGLFGREIAGAEGRDLGEFVGRAIRDGRLPSGTRLPTVRDIAQLLGVSSGTVAAAWTRLRDEGLVVTNRRGGTLVNFDGSTDGEPTTAPAWMSVDLSNGIADPNLQMPLAEALAVGARTASLNAPGLEAITPALLDAVRPSWPFEAEAFVTAAGGSQGILLAIEAATEPGDTIAIEQPSSPRLLDMARARDLKLVGVACDDEGPLPRELAQALEQSPTAFVYQPRAHIPLGHAVSERRIAELAAVLTGSPNTIVVEDDNVGPIAELGSPSLGMHLPDRTIHMRAYCRTYGLDLRTSVLGGAQRLIDRAAQARSRGGVMQSRILQNAMAYLITDPHSQQRLAQARRRYAWRRTTLIAALTRLGVEATNPDGIMVWIEVADEQAALVSLASYGIAAGPGSKCFIEPQPLAFLRIATSRLPDDRRLVSQLASTIARAIADGGRQSFD